MNMGDKWYCSDCMSKDNIRQNLDNVVCGYADDLSNGVCPTCSESEYLVWFAECSCEQCPMKDECCQ